MTPGCSAATRTLFWAGLLAIAAGTVLPASAQSAGSRPIPAQPPAGQSAQRWLEFDPPPDEAEITGFQVGYFPPGRPTPAFVFEVPRSKAQRTAGRSLRLPLMVGDLPPGRTFEIRLRTVAGGRLSAWSAPSGTFTVPGAPAAGPAGGATDGGGSRRNRRARSAVAELRADGDLLARLMKEFPGVKILEVADGYRQARDLAADLFAARNLDLSFAEIRKRTAGAGNRNLRQAIADLKPGVDARAEQRRARQQARELVEGR